MNNPNITIKEYIMLKEEKARRRGKVYNWETATYGKIGYDEDVHDLRFVETEFPAIVFNDTLTSEEALSCKPMCIDLLDVIQSLFFIIVDTAYSLNEYSVFDTGINMAYPGEWTRRIDFRVAKLPEKLLILPSEEVNTEYTYDKSLFGIALHPITLLEQLTSDMEEDSNMASIPDDELSKSEERDADKVLEELVELNAYANKSSLSKLHDELSNLTTKGKLDYCTTKVDQNSINVQDMTNLIKDMVYLLESTSVFAKANADGEKWEKVNPDPSISEPDDQNHDSTQGEQLIKSAKTTYAKEDQSTKQPPSTTEQAPQTSNALIVHSSEKVSEESKEEKPIEDEPPIKIQKILQDVTDKGVAIKEDPLKELIPLVSEGGSNPKVPNFKPFITSERPMTIEEFKAQLAEMQRLEALKQEEKKSEESLKKIINPANIRAQAKKIA
nr:hypothetical protein [Tanacetum cinerariifolium]